MSLTAHESLPRRASVIQREQNEAEIIHQYFQRHKVIELFDGMISHLDFDQPADPVLGAIWYLSSQCGLKPPSECPEPTMKPVKDTDDDAERHKRDKEKREKERLEREKKEKEAIAKREEALRKANERQKVQKEKGKQDEASAADMASCF